MPINIGRSLRIARADKKMTNAAIGEMVGLHPISISRMASARSANSETIEKLAKAFGMTVYEFMALGEAEDESQEA